MLYIGEKVGKSASDSMEVDIAVDPLDGTTLIAKGLPNVISVIAIGSKGSLLNAPDTYMKKIVVGPKAKGAIDLNKTAEELDEFLDTGKMPGLEEQSQRRNPATDEGVKRRTPAEPKARRNRRESF